MDLPCATGGQETTTCSDRYPLTEPTSQRSGWPGMPPFIAGIDLARRFYAEVVSDLVRCPHAACLLGEGSDVLGYDQPRSTDHAWRSEEHTSELQSLMRISYAGFCLKQKTDTTKHSHH